MKLILFVVFFNKGIEIRSRFIKYKLSVTASSPGLIPIFCFSIIPFIYNWTCSMVYSGLKYWLIFSNSGIV